MKLTDEAVKSLTVEELAHLVFENDASAQVRLMEVTSRALGASMHFSVTYTVEVPTSVALDALASFSGMKVVVP